MFLIVETLVWIPQGDLSVACPNEMLRKFRNYWPFLLRYYFTVLFAWFCLIAFLSQNLNGWVFSKFRQTSSNPKHPLPPELLVALPDKWMATQFFSSSTFFLTLQTWHRDSINLKRFLLLVFLSWNRLCFHLLEECVYVGICLGQTLLAPLYNVAWMMTSGGKCCMLVVF